MEVHSLLLRMLAVTEWRGEEKRGEGGERRRGERKGEGGGEERRGEGCQIYCRL